MKYCLIGKNLNGSLSPLIHSLSGVDYALEEIPIEDVVKLVIGRDYDGFNVTMPFKRQIIAYLDGGSDIAKLCNTVNTVKIEGEKLIGYNTDYGGMKFALSRAGISLKDKNVLVLGGGATKDTATALAKAEGAKSVNFVSRRGEISYENCYELIETQIIINATPVGRVDLNIKKSVDLKKFANLEGVLDCVYNPYRTPLLSETKSLGLKTAYGLDMLVEQALLSEDIWLGSEHTQSFADEILRKIKEKTLNVVLIGMPSCGKSSIGKRVAQALDKPFYDTDEMIEADCGASCESIINERGEKFFRKVEKDAVARLNNVRGAVIAVGGGTLLDEANKQILQGNGILIYIKRDFNLLKSCGRPLSAGENLKELYEKRLPVYAAAADAQIENDEDISACVSKVIKAYESSCN